MAELNTERVEELRALLQERKHALRRELNEEVAALGRDYVDRVVQALDNSELSIQDVTESVGIKLIDAHRRELAQLVLAEHKLEAGTYGICENCGGAIAAKRLRALPYTPYCVRCADLLEGDEVHGRGPSL